MKKFIPLAKNGQGQYKCLDTETLSYKNIGNDEMDLIQDYLDNSGIHPRKDGGQALYPLKAINGTKALKVFLGYDSESQKYIIADLSESNPVKRHVDEAEIFDFIDQKTICNIELMPDGKIDISMFKSEEYITFNTDLGKVKILASEVDQFYDSEGSLTDLDGLFALIDKKKLEMFLTKLEQSPPKKPSTYETEEVYLSRDLGLDDKFVTTKREMFKHMLFTIGPREAVRVPLAALKGLEVKWLLTLDDRDYSKIKVNAEQSFNTLSYLLTTEIDYPHDIIYIASIKEKGYYKVYILSRSKYHDNSMVRALCMSDWVASVSSIMIEKMRIDYKEMRKYKNTTFF